MVHRHLLALVLAAALLASAGCLADTTDSGNPSSDPTDEPGAAQPVGSQPHGLLVVDEANRSLTEPISASHDAIQSTEPLRTAVQRYRQNRTRIGFGVDDDRYNATKAGLRGLRGGGPYATLVDVDDTSVSVRLVVNGTY